MVFELISLLLSLLSSSCVHCVVFGVGASTRVSWQSQHYFEETIRVRHPPKAIHPEKSSEQTKFFCLASQGSTRKLARVFSKCLGKQPSACNCFDESPQLAFEDGKQNIDMCLCDKLMTIVGPHSIFLTPYNPPGKQKKPLPPKNPVCGHPRSFGFFPRGDVTSVTSPRGRHLEDVTSGTSPRGRHLGDVTSGTSPRGRHLGDVTSGTSPRGRHLGDVTSGTSPQFRFFWWTGPTRSSGVKSWSKISPFVVLKSWSKFSFSQNSLRI